jgi:hypothetical protein
MGYTTRRRLNMSPEASEIASKSVYVFAKVNNIPTIRIVEVYQELGRKITMKEVDFLIQTNKRYGNQDQEEE